MNYIYDNSHLLGPGEFHYRIVQSGVSLEDLATKVYRALRSTVGEAAGIEEEALFVSRPATDQEVKDLQSEVFKAKAKLNAERRLKEEKERLAHLEGTLLARINDLVKKYRELLPDLNQAGELRRRSQICAEVKKYKSHGFDKSRLPALIFT